MKTPLWIPLIALLLLGGCFHDKKETSVMSDAPASAAPSAHDLYGFYEARDDEAVAMIVNGKRLPQSLIDTYAGESNNEVNVTAVQENVLVSELILQASARDDLLEDPLIRNRLALAVYNVIGETYIQNYIESHRPTDEEVTAKYSELSEQYADKQEYLSSHILVEDKALAEDIIKQLQEDFTKLADLAAEHSIDTGSAQNKGSLGWSDPDIFVPEFSAALQQLEVGKFTLQPIESQFGWHVIALQDTRPIEIPELNDDLRERIATTIQYESVQQLLEEMKTKATVEITGE